MDIMSKDIIKVKRATSFKELLSLFSKFHTFPLVPVVEKDGRLIGTVSFPNLIKIFQPHHLDILKTIPFIDHDEPDIFRIEIEPGMENLFLVEDLMEKKFFSIEKEKTIEEAYRLMRMHALTHLPVVDSSGKLLGMIGIFDIIVHIFQEKGIIK